MKAKLFLVAVVLTIVNCQMVLAQSSRLVGATVHYYTTATSSQPTDSIAYFYVDPHGGDLSHIMKFTTDTDWSYVSSLYSPFGVVNQTFDAASNIATTTHLVKPSGSFVNASLYTNTYDASHNNTSTLVQNWDPGTSSWVDSLRYDHTYGSAGYVSSTTDYSWDKVSSAFIPWLHDTSYNVSPAVGVRISYDWSSLTVTGTWINSSLDSFFYDGSGYLISDINYVWNIGTSTWNKGIRYSFHNNSAGHTLTDTEYRWQGSPASWQNLFAYTYTYDGSENILTNTYIHWTGTAWLYDDQFVSTYNTSNQVTSGWELLWDAGSSSYIKNATYRTLYYYQTYSGVSSLKNIDATVNIFPNPAGNILNIQIKWDEPEPFDVAVYDMTGRIMTNIEENATNNYNKQIPVNYWPAGNYSVVVKTNNGSTAKSFVVNH